MGDADSLPRPAPRRPKAQAEQLSVEEWENELLAKARSSRPAVAWWHGYRHIGPLYGSYCYVCETTIATWSALADIPPAAQEFIHEHKYAHQPR